METQNTMIPFAIIGGGIAGLTTAIALKRIGIDAAVFEAAQEFKPVGAGIVLAANALKVYNHLGIYNELRDHGYPLEQLIICDQKGNPVNSQITEDVDKDWGNLAIQRALLHKVLLSQLNENNIFIGKKSERIEPVSEGYKVFFSDGSFIYAKYIIVADGIHSGIRKQLLPGSKTRYSGYTCWRGIAENQNYTAHNATETWGKKGRFGIVPVGGGKIYWFAVKNAKFNDTAMKNYGIGELSEIFKGYHDPVQKVLQSTAENKIIWNDISDLKPVHQYAFGNIVLVGDAAHATTPNMGQGACQAIEDAYVLANCLKENSIVKEAFLSYEKKRLKRTHYVVNRSWQTGKIAQIENGFLIFIRNFILRLLPRSYYKSQLKKIIDFKL